MIDKLQAHYGFTRMPFGRDLAPGMLHRHAARNEAVARITWCIADIGNHRYPNVLNDHLRDTCAA
jgi:type II secretory pathway predicted ATPase ExeA